MKRRLSSDRYPGFDQLRPARIHLACPECGLKRSNSARGEFDPPTAVVAVMKCPNCGSGDKDDSPTYRDAQGQELCWACGRRSCGRRCDERLIRQPARPASEKEGR